jgi:DNA-binding Lrp family transcriptional regulator
MINYKSFYGKSHLVVAAIRLLEYKTNAPPTMEQICSMLSISLEEAHRLCRKLEDLHVIDLVETLDEARVYIKDHRKIEEIPVEDDVSKLESELIKFKKSREELSKKVETLQAEQAEKRKKLHEELEKKLKKEFRPV